MTKQAEPVRRAFFGDGLFEWQMPTGRLRESWNRFTFDTEKWWGTFPRDEAPASPGRRSHDQLFAEFPWAVGPFQKYPGNPVLAPSQMGWDPGRFDGGVHNGAVVRHGGKFHYVYRGE